MTRTKGSRIKPRTIRLRQQREHGAVFLLQSYVFVSCLALLASVFLMRSTNALRAATLSVEGQQAFWLAETAADQAMAALRTTPPALNVNACQDSFTSVTDRFGTASTRVCLTRISQAGATETQQYQLEATSRVQQATHTALLTVDRGTDALSFEHFLYGGTIAMRTDGGITGTLATYLTQPGSISIDSGGGATVYNDVYVGPGADVSDPALLHLGQTTLLGQLRTMEEPLPELEPAVPADAQPLGTVNLSSGQELVLEPGTYVADEVLLTGGHVRTNGGLVTLYVTGRIRMRHGGQLLGLVHDSPTASYEPENLLIIDMGTTASSIGDYFDQEMCPQQFGYGPHCAAPILAAMIYAPHKTLGFGAGSFTGAVRAEHIVVDTEMAVTYWQSLANQSFPIGQPVVSTRFWGLPNAHRTGLISSMASASKDAQSDDAASKTNADASKDENTEETQQTDSKEGESADYDK